MLYNWALILSAVLQWTPAWIALRGTPLTVAVVSLRKKKLTIFVFP